MPAPSSVAIVGGGIAGLCLARELARSGAGVDLFEAGEIGRQGASSLPAALLNPYRGRSGRASALDLAGLDAFWDLQRELGAQGLAGGANRSGVLRLASSERQAKGWRAAAARDPGLDWLGGEGLPDSLHAPHGALLVRGGGWVEAPILLRALATAARAAGAGLHEGVRVHALAPGHGGVRVRSDLGERTFARVVLCVGASRAAELPLPPLERVAGDIVRLGAESELLPRPLAGAVYGVQLGAAVFVGGNHRPAEQRDPQAPQALRRSFGWFAPGLRHAAIEGVWTGVRARRPGNAPLVTQLAPGVWLFGALAGRGFLCAPLLARRLSETLLQQRAPDSEMD